MSQLAPYRAIHDGVRWTDPASWHLTLLFLGSVRPERVSQLRGLVDELTRDTEPYRVRADAGGGRVRGRDGVAWIGLGQGAGRLIELASDLAARCPADLAEGAPPRRTPSAHLTVVRRADRRVIEALRQRSHGPLGVGWTVDRLVLVRSHLSRDGARYETLYEAAM